MVGTATWGPVGVPVTVSDMKSYLLAFGTPVARKFDMGTHVAAAAQQNANNFRCVRVTDGTDVSASVSDAGQTASITFTAAYSGSLGNSISVQILTGSKASTWKAVVSVPGGLPEVFDNIPGTAGVFWTNLAAAINTGAAVTRGRSNMVIATRGTGTLTVAAATYTLTGGTDGADGVASSGLIGLDTAQRTGMYALRNTACSLLDLCDMDDTTQYTTVGGFAEAEGMYAVLTGPSGDSIANAITTKNTAGLDNAWAKLMLGDWVLWNDPFIQTQRYISPQGFTVGVLASITPNLSALNKPMNGVVGTQRSGLGIGQAMTYSNAELTQLGSAGIDVITNPGAGGLNIWTCRFGHNSASEQDIQGDNYTRMTNFIAATLNAGMGAYIGRVINTELSTDVHATLTSFFLVMMGAKLLSEQSDGSLPFSVTTALGPNTINPPEQTKLGIFRAGVQVEYDPINEKFVIDLEGGQTVTPAQRVNAITPAIGG
jgi:hypothetical protein